MADPTTLVTTGRAMLAKMTPGPWSVHRAIGIAHYLCSEGDREGIVYLVNHATEAFDTIERLVRERDEYERSAQLNSGVGPRPPLNTRHAHSRCGKCREAGKA